MMISKKGYKGTTDWETNLNIPLTAPMTNLICVVSVAHVKWVYICLVSA